MDEQATNKPNKTHREREREQLSDTVESISSLCPADGAIVVSNGCYIQKHGNSPHNNPYLMLCKLVLFRNGS